MDFISGANIWANFNNRDDSFISDVKLISVACGGMWENAYAIVFKFSRLKCWGMRMTSSVFDGLDKIVITSVCVYHCGAEVWALYSNKLFFV